MANVLFFLYWLIENLSNALPSNILSFSFLKNKIKNSYTNSHGDLQSHTALIILLLIHKVFYKSIYYLHVDNIFMIKKNNNY